MNDNQENINEEEFKNLSYSELSEEVRKKAKTTGKNFIPILYKKLLDERKKPEEAKIILEHDFKDIWSISYINQFIPQEAKREEKVRAGKLGQKKKQAIQITTSGNSAKLLEAENDSIGKNKEESYSNYFKEKPKPLSKEDAIREIESLKQTFNITEFVKKEEIDVKTLLKEKNIDLSESVQEMRENPREIYEYILTVPSSVTHKLVQDLRVTRYIWEKNGIKIKVNIKENTIEIIE